MTVPQLLARPAAGVWMLVLGSLLSVWLAGRRCRPSKPVRNCVSSVWAKHSRKRSKRDSANWQRACARRASPYRIDSHIVPCGASIGIALYPQHGSAAASLLAAADRALYTAITQGGLCYRFFARGELSGTQHEAL